MMDPIIAVIQDITAKLRTSGGLAAGKEQNLNFGPVSEVWISVAIREETLETFAADKVKLRSGLATMCGVPIEQVDIAMFANEPPFEIDVLIYETILAPGQFTSAAVSSATGLMLTVYEIGWSASDTAGIGATAGWSSVPFVSSASMQPRPADGSTNGAGKLMSLRVYG